MTHRGELTERLLEIQLLLAERPYSQKELKEHFKVGRKTIKGCIDALSVYLQIEEEKVGREVFYKYSDDYQFVPPNLTAREVATLLLAQQAIAASGLTTSESPFAYHARSLMMKVKNALPKTLRERLDAMSNVFGTAAVPAKSYEEHASTVDKLIDAAVRQRRVSLHYFSLTDGKTKERTVEPYCVYSDPDGATLKLIGYDHLRKSVTPFSIDHIRNIRITEETFVRPEDFDLREYLNENCFNGIHGEPITVRLRAFGSTARIFAERQFHPSQKPIKGSSKNETTIEMRVAGGRGLVRFILSWLPEIEVLSPASLRDEIQKICQQGTNFHSTKKD
jgi:predicted DNA-binding transcriptional regulator YafY